MRWSSSVPPLGVSGATVAPSGFDPIGITVDAANRVYIADTDNDRVEVFSTS